MSDQELGQGAAGSARLGHVNAIAVEDRPVDEPWAYSPADAARKIGVSRKHIYELMSRGQLHSVLIGRCRRIPRNELARLAGLSGPDAA
jgi:excisionase family DNA binding protein